MAKAGRKPTYTPERVATICKALSEGETVTRAAALAGIGETTYYEWLDRYPEFADSVKRAKEDFEQWQLDGILQDAKRGLKTLVCGMEYESVKTEYVGDADGKPTVRRQTKETRRIPPNATAIIFALCNRDPEHWQNRVTSEISGRLETGDGRELSLKDVPDDLLRQVVEAIKPLEG